MSLSPIAQQNIFTVLVIIWFLVEAVLVFRAKRLEKPYLRRLPPVNGVPLDIHLYVVPDWKKGWHGPVWRAFREPQADPELERMRLEAQRRWRIVFRWSFGVPVLMIGKAALLIATSMVRPQ